MLHTHNVSKVNAPLEVSLADGLVCPACETPSRTFDLETLDPLGLRVICSECGQDIASWEEVR